MSRTVREIEAELRELAEERAAITEELHKARARKRVKCEGCGKRSAVAKLTYIQTHFYITPYGCTGGDYWREGEGQFVCPHCGGRNRLYNRPDVVALKRYFAEVEKVHER